MLSQVTDFNFNWHNMYIYADDVAPLLPKGTILHLLAWYDNTKANKSNPDPDQWVGWGDRTVDEMGHAWLNITYYNDDEFKAETAARAAKTVNTTRRSPAAVTRRNSSTLQGAVRFGRRLFFRSSQESRDARSSICQCRVAVAVVRRSAARSPARGQQGVGQTPSSLPLTAPIRERGIERHARVRGLVLRQGRQRSACWSATSTATRSRSSTFRSARTTASSRAGPIRASRRTSRRPPVGRLHDQAAEGLRHQEADVDDRRQRLHQHDHAAHAGRLHRRAVRGRGEQEHAAEAQVPARRSARSPGAPTGIAEKYTATVGVPLRADGVGRPTKGRRSTFRNRAAAARPRRGASRRATRPRRGAAPARRRGRRAARRRDARFTPPPPIAVTWTKFRGPGDVKFDNHEADDRSRRRRQGDDERDVQRAGRLHPARRGQRFDRRGRRRLPVLLDQRARRASA